MAAKFYSFQFWRFQRLSLVGQFGFLHSSNVGIVAVEVCQQLSNFAADSVRFPLHQS